MRGVQRPGLCSSNPERRSGGPWPRAGCCGPCAAGRVELDVIVLEKNTLHLGDHRSICLLFLNNSGHNLENERGSQEPTAARCWPKRIELIVGAGEG